MKKNTITHAAMALALCCTASTVMAQSMYLVGAAGSSIPASNVKADIDALLKANGATNLQSSMGNGTAMKLALGFNVNTNFAIEGGYFDSGTLTYTGTATGATVAADSKATGFQFALIGNAPLSDSFSIFAKAGYTAVSVKSYARINSTSASGTNDKNNGGVGFGAKYKISEKLWLRGEWEQVASDVSAITFGVESRF